jgi:hypothetical protein
VVAGDSPGDGGGGNDAVEESMRAWNIRNLRSPKILLTPTVATHRRYEEALAKVLPRQFSNTPSLALREREGRFLPSHCSRGLENIGKIAEKVGIARPWQIRHRLSATYFCGWSPTQPRVRTIALCCDCRPAHLSWGGRSRFRSPAIFRIDSSSARKNSTHCRNLSMAGRTQPCYIKGHRNFEPGCSATGG